MECHTHDKKNKTGIMRLYENAPNKAVFVSIPQRRVQRQNFDAIEIHEATFHLNGNIEYLIGHSNGPYSRSIPTGKEAAWEARFSYRNFVVLPYSTN